MLTVIVGTPPIQKKAYTPHTPPVEDVEWESVPIEELLAIATTSQLMGDTRTLRLTGALAGDVSEEFLDMAKVWVESPHHFIFIEEKLLKKPTDLLTKVGAKIDVHKPPTKESLGTSFNMFGVTASFVARDRKKLWLDLLEATRKDVVPEAFLGMLHWKVRDMLGRGDTKKYSKEELKKVSYELVCLYHDSHRGKGDLSLLLEQYILLL